MLMRISIAAVIVLISCSASAGIFQGDVAGVVLDEKSSAKISGVAISLQVKAIFKSNLAQTGPDGRFEIDFKQILPDLDLRRSTIELIFHKPGYDQSVIVLNTDADNENWDQQEIRLIKSQEIEKLPEPLREAIQKHRSEKGKTLYLSPYYVDKATETLQLKMFAQNLLDNITASLRTTVQAAPGVEMDVSIQPLSDIDITATNIERLYQFGEVLNALAMISGIGEMSSDDLGKQEIYLRSNYVTIPSAASLRPGNVTIKDQFPAPLLNSLRLSEYLNKYWGHHTALALCIQEFHEAMTPSRDNARLEKVEKLIIASRSQLSGDNQVLKGQFDMLLNIVIKESSQ
jgi:hypothetical protein